MEQLLPPFDELSELDEKEDPRVSDLQPQVEVEFSETKWNSPPSGRLGLPLSSSGLRRRLIFVKNFLYVPITSCVSGL